jgi:hypothetical protein
MTVKPVQIVKGHKMSGRNNRNARASKEVRPLNIEFIKRSMAQPLVKGEAVVFDDAPVVAKLGYILVERLPEDVARALETLASGKSLSRKHSKKRLAKKH